MPSVSSWSLSFPEPDIALASIATPGKGVNLLAHAVLDELDALLDELVSRGDLAGLILASGKPGTFIAGADVTQIAKSLSLPRDAVLTRSRRGQTVLGRLAQLPCVTVAACDGVCLGGGAELACWCDRRVLADTPHTEFGFPEVTLGLIPGWGGTACFPRIVGIGNAAGPIVTGETIDGPQAVAMGLADDLVPAERLLAAAVRAIRIGREEEHYRVDRQRRSRPLEIGGAELRFLKETVQEEVRRRIFLRHTAPQVALDLLIEAAERNLEEACQLESAALGRLYGLPENAALLNVFFLTEWNKRRPVGDVPPRPVRSVGVIGAGVMGASIAAASVRHELRVLVTDAAAEKLDERFAGIIEEAAFCRRLHGPDPAVAPRLAPLLVRATSAEALAACELVVETVVENANVKRKVLQRMEQKLPPDAVLTSNTSTIPIAQLAAGLERPERFCGLHFFNPVRHMKLVEVVRGPGTSEQTVATVVAFAKRIGKMPVVVHDGPGFLVNRLLAPYLNEALQLVCEGVPVEAIDHAAVAFGMPLGPLALYDLIGIDTAFYAGRIMWEAFPDRIAVSPVLPALFRKGRIGRKSGLGFYAYRSPEASPEPDPAVAELMEPYVRQRREYAPEEITFRLFLPVVVEATRALQAGIARDPRDVDLGTLFGLGFPRSRGGLLFWADTLGVDCLLRELCRWEDLGVRYQPTEMLCAMARDHRRFYPGGPPSGDEA